VEDQKTAQGLVVKIHGVSYRNKVSKSGEEMFKVLDQDIYIDVFQLSVMNLPPLFGMR